MVSLLFLFRFHLLTRGLADTRTTGGAATTRSWTTKRKTGFLGNGYGSCQRDLVTGSWCCTTATSASTATTTFNSSVGPGQISIAYGEKVRRKTNRSTCTFSPSGTKGPLYTKYPSLLAAACSCHAISLSSTKGSSRS